MEYAIWVVVALLAAALIYLLIKKNSSSTSVESIEFQQRALAERQELKELINKLEKEVGAARVETSAAQREQAVQLEKYNQVIANRQELQSEHNQLKSEYEEIRKRSQSTSNNLFAANSKLAQLEEQLNKLGERYNALEGALEKKTNENLELERRNSHLSSDKKGLEERLESQKQDMIAIKDQMTKHFELVSTRQLENNTSKFSDLSRVNLETVLKPLSENLEKFKKQVEDTYSKEKEDIISLREQIKLLQTHTQEVERTAENLANALRGDKRQQGDWGEGILEMILEHSGLQKGVSYFPQKSFSDEGGRHRPDFIIKLPDNKEIVIDAKVSLVSYEAYTCCKDEEEAKAHLKTHINAVRKHVKDLSGREYERFTNEYGFVIMFMPIETAYIAALQGDSQLWKDAYNSKVVLMSPTNLIAALRLISDIWKREEQARNLQEIVKRGGKLYDKVCDFINDFETVGSKLGDATRYFEKANIKINGKGSIKMQAETLRGLGIETKKSPMLSPEQIIEDTDEEEDELRLLIQDDEEQEDSSSNNVF